MFTSIIQRLRRLARDECGPTGVEYAVMLAMIIVVVIGSVRLLGATSNSVFRSAENAIDQKTDGNPDGHGQW